MMQAQLLVKKCYDEVEEILMGEENNMIAGRQWVDLAALVGKKQSLSEMSLEAFNNKVTKEKPPVATCLRAFCEQMIALVPDHSVNTWMDISSFEDKK